MTYRPLVFLGIISLWALLSLGGAAQDPTPFPSPAPAPPLPAGYEIRRQLGRPARIPANELPWQVYSNEPAFQPAVVHALNSWNELGRRNGMGLIYELASSPSSADLIIDWNGSGLPSNRASAVWWNVSFGRLQVTGLSMDGRMKIPMGNFAQLLMHELGHPLGLDHSVDRQDIMFETMHTRRYTAVDQSRFTERDFQAFRALYSLADCWPISGRRGRLSKSPSAPTPSSSSAQTQDQDQVPATSGPGATPTPESHPAAPVSTTGQGPRAGSTLEVVSWRDKDGVWRYAVGSDLAHLGGGRSRADFEELLQSLAPGSRLRWRTSWPAGHKDGRRLGRPIGEEWENFKAIINARDLRLLEGP